MVIAGRAKGDSVPARGRERGLGGRARRVRTVSLGCAQEARVGRSSERTAAVAAEFGLPLFARRVTVVARAKVEVGPGRIVLLLGPSGSGKSSALGMIQTQYAGGRMVDRVSFPNGVAILDRVAPWAQLAEAVSILTNCGLGEARLWIKPFAALSDGEKFRAKLARAVAEHLRSGVAAPLLCDEFGSALHRRMAKAISFALRKVVTRRGLSVVLACSNEDVVADLQPNAIVHLHGGGRCRVEERRTRAGKPATIRRRVRIERGCKRDYDVFSRMHYRATDELGFVDKVFVMRDGSGGDPLGIVVYSHGPLELSLRNHATAGWFSRNPGRVNRSLRILRRLVIHPDVRGCGLGHHLVRKTLPLVGTEYVECLATMGEFNPVFEKAGMLRIGQYDVSSKTRAALRELKALGVDPGAHDFFWQVCRRRRVREIVSRVVYEWYAATTAGGERRVDRQSPQLLAQMFRGVVGSRPVYYLWRRGRRTVQRKQCA